MQDVMQKQPLTIYLAGPRGFCSGVDRAIEIVEKALEKYGAPVYVRHEIVHNKFVVDQLRDKGAVFVEEITEVPDDRPVIFSAHGVAKSVPAAAVKRDMHFIDATCPLVSKVHREVERHHKNGCHVLLIGHKGHPEVIGTMGQVPKGSVSLIETKEQAATMDVPAGELAYATQTTLSVDDTAEILTVLQQRFPHLQGPKKEDICYATTNRQDAVKAVAEKCDAFVVVGAQNSSNSKRLVETAKQNGCAKAMLLDRAVNMDWQWLEGVGSLGITAGASAPEILVEELVAGCRKHFDVTVENAIIREENIKFKLPKELQAA